ncbi:MAG: PD40 domain-containing protein, partial [Bacteroidia bacterium]|nr:PD40 domain-containing protein [Bacteroidia bacterium]
MRNIVTSLAIFVCCNSFFAQRGDYKHHMVEGNLLLLEENYMRALTEFQKAYAFDSLSANVNYKIGFCYLKHPSEKHLAEKYLEKATANINPNYDEEDPLIKSAPPIAYFYLGKAYHLDYKLDEALNMFDTYKSYLNPKKYKAEIELVEHNEKMCRYAHERIGSPANVRIINMGDSVNSKYAEVSPVLSADERLMIFTYAGPLSTGAAYGNRTPEDGFFEDIFVCYKNQDGTWSKPDTLPGNVNTNQHDGAVGLSADGQTLIIYRDDNGDGNLYYTTWNGVEWETPTKFGPQI